MFTTVLVLLFSSLSLFAKWAAASKPHLVAYSDLIVVAELASTQTSEQQGIHSKQSAQLKVITILKGEAAESIVVDGEITGACRPEYVFPDEKNKRYLLFLKKDGKACRVWNGHFAALEITEEKVNWFVDAKNAYERKPTPLKEVQEQILNLVTAEAAKP